MRLEQPSTMSDFNTNTNKKEDVSTKLKAINIRKAKGETKQLEAESKKMEERLKELRMAMNREKEERERQGGGYWRRGQTGNLNNYATDVLNTKPAKAPAAKDGKRKVKVLKDTPIEVPDRPKHPGTMAHIAKQDASLTPRSRNIKGPKCGQCEEKKAAVSCVQCSEHYCASCFAAFHLRGALKKHRSVPLSASGPRVCMSPRPPQPSNGDRSIDFHAPPPAEGGRPEDPYLAKIKAQRNRDRNSPEGASGSFDQDGLMGSDYNEAESAASFQQALLAWRNGDEAPKTPPKPAPKKRASPRKVAYSPVRTPTVQVEFGTSTVEEKENIEIKFTSTMSYADRLLLKKHRRTEVGKMATPRVGDWEEQDEPDPRSRSITPYREHRTRDRHQMPRQDPWLAGPSTPRVEPLFSSREEDLPPVNFQALYEAVKYSESGSSQPSRTVSGGMTIEEIDDDVVSPALKRVEETSACLVQELDDPQAWALNQNGSSINYHQNAVNDTTPPKSRKSRRTPRTPGGKSKSRLQAEPVIQTPDPEDYERVQSPLQTEPHLAKSTQNRARKSYVEYNSPSETSRTQPPPATPDQNTATMKPPTSSAKSRPKSSAKSRPQSSAKSRPQSSARTKSRQNSYTQSRPGSRTKSRANSRMEGEGVLTKGPSQGLLQVAMMNQDDSLGEKQKSYSSAFNEFFMLGVQPTQTDRTMTPSKLKDSRTDKVKVSSQLYQMAPQSWRPDSSLADTVDTETVQEDSAVMEMVEANTPVPLDITDQPHPLDLGGRASVLSFINNEMDSITQKAEANMMSLLTKELSFDDEAELQFGDDLEEEEEEDDFPDLPPTPANLKVTTPRPSSSVRSRPDSGTPRPSSSASRPASHRQSHPHAGNDRPDSSFSVRSSTVTPRPDDITPRPVSVTRRFASTTPRPGSRSTSQAQGDGRESRTIIVDGEDMSNYDQEGLQENSFMDDQETLNNLEWELASETGRITADGKVSRMELEETGSNGSADSSRSFSRMSQQDQGYDINSRLREDELMDDEEDEDDFEDEEDVKALH